jgi:hypothetical protein
LRLPGLVDRARCLKGGVTQKILLFNPEKILQEEKEILKAFLISSMIILIKIKKITLTHLLKLQLIPNKNGLEILVIV